jgi:N-acetylneuraminate synthase/N,N'-diacetyllegionaminate synthase
MARAFIIAEAGVNHDGSVDVALRLVETAKACGADAVKFQSFRADRIVTRSAAKAVYQERTTAGTESHFEMLKRLELSADAHRRLIDHCREVKIEFLSSPFDEESVDLLDAMGISQFKVPSGEITNLPLLQHIARKRRPVILSTGMATLGEVEEAVHALHAAGAAQITLLHCVTEYPAPYAEINLRAMLTLKAAFGLPVGYSDHTDGVEVAIAAVALGAEVIEKHFTLDRALPGPDHAASLEPAELTQMVAAIRNVESALGNGIKVPAPCERQNILVARKSVVAAHDLPIGRRLRAEDLTIKRPGTGISPKFLQALIGRTLRTSVKEDEVINWNHLA